MLLVSDARGSRAGLWWAAAVVLVAQVAALHGPNVCIQQQKYNVTKRVKYRAPMSVRSYEWCFAVPPRCSRWTTEMRDLTRLENEERTAEVAVCCPGYKMKDITCVPVCPSGKTGHKCTLEPEHITAMIDDKGTKTSSLDLISLLSIAGGVMMSIITVAVIIVMIERCRRPKYEDIRRANQLHMKTMMDTNGPPPSYSRRGFHAPLPDPPTLDKSCHYQPISTLDRNLKQFMRPVTVQAISPIMIENFRGILECHYDHLPQRRQFEENINTAPSMSSPHEPLYTQLSQMNSIQHEARLEVLDPSLNEPLYAEIPCWRPPSEHAIEILTINSEAVTEL